MAILPKLPLSDSLSVRESTRDDEEVGMRDELDEQIDAFEAMLPEVKARYGAVWALVAGRRLISTFGDFAAAAEHADAHFATEQVLIRHTEAAPFETAPYVHIGS